MGWLRWHLDWLGLRSLRFWLLNNWRLVGFLLGRFINLWLIGFLLCCLWLVGLLDGSRLLLVADWLVLVLIIVIALLRCMNNFLLLRRCLWFLLGWNVLILVINDLLLSLRLVLGRLVAFLLALVVVK